MKLFSSQAKTIVFGAYSQKKMCKIFDSLTQAYVMISCFITGIFRIYFSGISIGLQPKKSMSVNKPVQLCDVFHYISEFDQW